ncbi:amino acid ABC transporter substrate-binding protein [Flavihumibacter sp. R14]|nr:amino acid ABC transporter substrate-binding protein [Flavihumibacter soli]
MILVPNHRPLLNGNKILLVLILAVLASCAKRTRPVVSLPPKETEKKEVPVKKEEAKAVVTHSIALILPFHLDQINPRNADLKTVRKADLAIDFYQGFKLALDSLSAEGNNYKLQVFDSQDNELQVVNLARARSVLNNDLIIGPIFPESIKTFGEFAELNNQLQVSPLAATDPEQFSNPKLVSLTNNIEQHGWKIADFINRNYKPASVNVLLINTRRNDEEKFAGPIRMFLKKMSNNGFTINERPNSIGLEDNLSVSKTNLVIIASSNRDFVLPTIDRLYKVSQGGTKIEVFGHPNWAKVQFLNAEKMQWLNTRISSSYFIDYKSASVKKFIARYSAAYGVEPTDYAFKAFDTGYYFGKLLSRYGDKYPLHLTDEEFSGLHNHLRFVKDEKSGYLNTELMILKYQGFELQVEK